MRKSLFLLLVFVAVAVCWMMLPDPAFAGPGGKIASAAFRTPWGRVVLGFLVVLFLPLFLYVWIKEAIAVRRSLRDLQRLAQVDERFDWLALKDRITDAFHRVHAAWSREDMREAAEWMTGWYWQNQQLVHLARWERDGLVNHCRVKSIKGIKPLFVRYRGRAGSLDGSRIVVAIDASMEDYLAERETGKVVEGKKGYAVVGTVWTFLHEGGRWLVANIEEGGMSLQYAKLQNELPELPSADSRARAAS